MRKIVLLISTLLIGIVAHAYDPKIRNIDIKCVLDNTGCAHITEVWDVCVAGGTEWYLVRTNLDEIEIKNLSVQEGDNTFQYVESWDVNASLYQKTGKCGLNKVYDGFEICWGVGSYGDHVFTVSYDMTNAVKSLNDYDMLHMQFISDQLSSAPQHASIELSVEGASLSADNAEVWGFGFDGYAVFNDGAIMAEASDGLLYDDSMILLIRLDKGILSNPSCVWDEDFQVALDSALEGSDWESGSSPFMKRVKHVIETVLNYLWLMIFPIYLYVSDAIKIRRFLGVSKKNVSWCREVPFQGDLCTTEFVLGMIAEGCMSHIASAMILQMIQRGAIEVAKSSAGDDKVDLILGDRSKLEGLPEPILKLWDLLSEACGDDRILQDKEFKEWSMRNRRLVSKWVDSVDKTGEKSFLLHGYGAKYGSKTRCTARGGEEALKALGFKKFILDFTLIGERASYEVALWDSYLVFGALFGVADKVAKELSDIAPEYQHASSVMSSMSSIHSAIGISNSLSSSIASASTSGGRSSRGGGGGFSGGGHGGGSR